MQLKKFYSVTKISMILNNDEYKD